jgi:hypothetical protein
MAKFALYVPLEAKAGKEAEVSEFLRSTLPLAEAERGTISWFDTGGAREVRNLRHIR